MTIQLQEGVRLTVIPTQKYKTLRIFLRFSAPHEKVAATKRTLLSSLLETNSLNYPDHVQLSSALANLYGASFGLNVGKKGGVHQVNVAMSLVNGKYINHPEVFAEGMAFLKEILFQPNIQTGAFDEATFQLEKEHLLSYVNSIREDKQTWASLRLQELYFGADEDQKTPSFGSAEVLEKLTAEDLAQAHEQMLAQDGVDIFIVGDLSEAEALEQVQTFPFPKTSRVQPELLYQKAPEQLICVTENEEITQAKLNLGYQTGVYYGTTERFALMIFNGLFGGFPHSKLFLNVREKESLAYYASSSVDTFRGFLSVKTGIDGKNREFVETLIAQQLSSLAAGEFSEEELLQTKVMLRNQYLLSLDQPQALIETAYLDSWLPKTKQTDDEFLAALMAVTKEDVQRVAENVQLKSVFFLDEERNHD